MILNRCDKLDLLSVLYDADLGPSTKVLLHRFIDRPASLLWSSERLAKSIRRSLATVERCLRELKELGIISTVRRRRQTVVKMLDVQRIRALAYSGVSAAKRACQTAMSLLKRGNFLTPQVRRPISIIDIRGQEEAPWKVQQPASAALLRFMGLPTGEKRR
jgi:DNA-binding transcriptional regulator YhcF (GntR family)